MAATETLFEVLAAEALLIGIALGVIFGHGLWLCWARHRCHARLAEGRAEVLTALEQPAPTVSTLPGLTRLPTALQMQLFVNLLPQLRGAARKRLAIIANRLGLTRGARMNCKSRFWWKRLYAVRLLASFGGDAVLLMVCLSDRHPLVRAAAAEWAADHPDPGVIQALLGLLSENHGLCRLKAQDALLRIGGKAIEALARFLAADRGPAIEPALSIAVHLPDRKFLTPALGLCRHHSAPIRVLAAALLGAIGGKEAVEALIGRLADPEAAVRSSAARGLGRLAHWPAAPKLYALLGDRAWTVRREAGLALHKLGPPGQLFLRRALGAPDRFAADMARQTLGLPSETEPTAVRRA